MSPATPVLELGMKPRVLFMPRRRSAAQLYHQMTRESSSDGDKTMAPWAKHEDLHLDP